MNVKEWLNRGFKLNKEIEQLLEAKQKALDLACNVVPNSNGEKIKGSTGNSTENKMIRYADYSKQLTDKINCLLEINKEIVETISKVDDTTLRCILTARYINFKTWEAISNDLNIDLRWIYRLHNRALSAIEKIDH